MIYSFDLETYHPAAELSEVGTAKYCEVPGLEVTCASAVDEHGVVYRWRPGAPPPPFAAGDTIRGWNVLGFDRPVWRVALIKHGWIDPDLLLWDDTMHRAANTNLPLKLSDCAKAMGSRELKDEAGHKLMLQLCRPATETMRDNDPKRRHTPGALDRLESYCTQDAVAEGALADKLPALSAAEVAVRDLDRLVNDRGVPVDVPFIDALIWVADEWRHQGRERLFGLTGGMVKSENARATFAVWLEQQGIDVPEGKGATDKEAISQYLEHEFAVGETRDALLLFQALGKTSLAKLKVMRAAACADGRLHGMMQYYGATQTGRWAGRMVQWQNMPRGILDKAVEYDEARESVRDAFAQRSLRGLDLFYGERVFDVLSSLLRTVVVPSPGNVLLDADYNAIEPRVVAWLAGCEKTLNTYRSGGDLYIMDAAVALHKDPKEITRKERNSLGKPCRIGFAYGLGGKKFSSYAEGYGATLSVEEGTRIIKAMRSAYPAIPALWRALDKAAMAAIRNPRQAYRAGRVTFGYADGHLRCQLPSGRRLWYREAQLVSKPAPWDPDKMLDAIEYAYQDQLSHQWVRGTTWGGTFTEQITQAVSRDLLVHGMQNCEARGLPVVLHVHDQALCDVPAGTDPKLLEAALCDLPAWAAGLPVKAEAIARLYWVK
jgi:DNA polymerase